MTDQTLDALCSFAAEISARPLSASMERAMKLRLLDTIGCGVAASTAEPVALACAGIGRLGGLGTCTVLAHGKAPVDNATLLNGFMFRYLDCNDTYFGPKNDGHASDVICAALAAGEAERRSGKEVLRAIAAGYEVFCGFCDAVNPYERGWDLSYLGVAAAIEAGILLGLSRAQMAHAIAIALVPQNALRQTRSGTLSHWKGIAAGYQASGAVKAAYMAAAGITGPDAPFEGRYGAIALVGGPMTLELDPARDRSDDFETKFFPVGNGILGPIELALELRGKLGDFARGDAAAVLQKVEGIEVFTYGDALGKWADTRDKWTPATHETADHSIPFCVALALGYGYLDYDALDRGIADANVLALTQKVRTVEDPEMSRRYPPAKAARVRVAIRGGSFEAALEAPLGNPLRPISEERLSEKFHAFADPVLGRRRAAQLEREIMQLDQRREVSGLLDVS